MSLVSPGSIIELVYGHHLQAEGRSNRSNLLFMNIRKTFHDKHELCKIRVCFFEEFCKIRDKQL